MNHLIVNENLNDVIFFEFLKPPFQSVYHSKQIYAFVGHDGLLQAKIKFIQWLESNFIPLSDIKVVSEVGNLQYYQIWDSAYDVRRKQEDKNNLLKS
jgi:hypothetical protein